MASISTASVISSWSPDDGCSLIEDSGDTEVILLGKTNQYEICTKVPSLQLQNTVA